MLEKLAEKVGIIRKYRCFLTNTDHDTTEDATKKILEALGFDVSSKEMVEKSYQNLILSEINEVLPPVIATRTFELPLKIMMNFASDMLETKFDYELLFENGDVFTGDFIPSKLHNIKETEICGKHFYTKELVLNIDGQWGYHNFKISDGKNEYSSLIIIAPKDAYKPDNLKHWGIPVQLYAIKSDNNWGIGDFSDLKKIIDNAEKMGASLVGLNPVTALRPHDPEGASPYSVSSRLYLNTMYIDVNAVYETEKSKEYKDFIATKEFKDKLKKVRNSEFVDYTGVSELKIKALRILFNCFIKNKDARYDSFNEYLKQEGDDAINLAIFQAICFEFKGLPEKYSDKNSKELKEWVRKNKSEVDFFAWIEWIAINQFKEASLECKKHNLKIGLYQDLAVGVSHDSAEVWANQEMFLKYVSIGSPPDDFCLDGQNWGLAPMSVGAMKKDRYQYFIKIIRKQMADSGALRIDHAMGLKRLFYIPDGANGAYFKYPFDEMLAIIVLESHRNSCVVIGEDLGNMPEGFSEQMNASGILSMVVGRWVVGYENLPDTAFMDKYMSLLAFSNHDMPTLAAYWQGKDLDLFKKFGFIHSDDEYLKQKQIREREKERLILNLSRKGLFFYDGEDMPKNLVYALYEYLAKSPNYLFLPQLEDVLMQEQQINLPGIDREHPNWRYKLELKIEDWLKDDRIAKFAKIMRDKYVV